MNNPDKPAISLVVAVAENGVIGKDDWMPWKLSSDMKRFKATTLGKPVIMGRKTFDSIGKPLPGRHTIVVTRNEAWRHDGANRAGSLVEALEIATKLTDSKVDEICIAGGGQIYAEALPMADRLRVTHVLAPIEGDTVFPPIDPAIWAEVSSQDFPAGERDSHATRYVIYQRI